MAIEQRFDVPFVAALALREKAIQQNYRPIIAVHKWFARRPGTLFRSLMLSEFVDKKLSQSYFLSHQLAHKTIADPFISPQPRIGLPRRGGCGSGRGLSVTATVPCPAEMSGSIHISGTKSAIVDTIFVCRSAPRAPGGDPAGERERLEDLLAIDVAKLRAGGVKPRPGDLRCLALGHLTRLAVAGLRADWDTEMATGSKIAKIAESMDQVADVDPVVDRVLSERNARNRRSQRELFEEMRA